MRKGEGEPGNEAKPKLTSEIKYAAATLSLTWDGAN
jgi:hypothetical protein